MKHIKIIGGVILGLFLIIAGVFWFLRITDVTVEGGEIYSEQEIISSALCKHCLRSLYEDVVLRVGHHFFCHVRQI